MENNSILGLMMRHHAALDLMLKLFGDEPDKKAGPAGKLFDDFRWELEKHIFAEDRVIFKLCGSMDSPECKLAEHLSIEHRASLDFLDKIEKSKDEKDISGLQALLAEHRKTEEKDLYPRLDEILTQRQKEIVFEKINDLSSSGQPAA